MMKPPIDARLLLGVLVLFAFTALSGSAQTGEHPELTTSEPSEALFGDDHMSEGVLLPMKDGRIRLVFRLDPGMEGDHVGTDAYIATSIYDPEADSWSEPESLYNSQPYDDRNIHGGVTREGRMVLFFRHYDGRKTRDRFFMYSDDDGESWSDPHQSDALLGIAGTGQMFYLPGEERYAQMQYAYHHPEQETYSTSMLLSKDGSAWTNRRTVVERSEVKLSEIAGAWAGDNRIVALIRDQTKRKMGHPLLQVVSTDNGKSWSEPRQTNIPPNNHWGCAPQLIYDASRNLLIALTSTRYTKPNDDQHLYIYTARPGEIVNDPQGWTLQEKLLRPWARKDWNIARPLNNSLYGYPTIAPINENEYLVTFAERARMKGHEQADIYYLRIKITKN